MIFLPGDIFLTRNATEAENTSPGYWNHCAIFTVQGIVEAQAAPIDAVIVSDMDEFVARYPEIMAFRIREDRGEVAANWAECLIGRPYKRAASIFNAKHGENCVSVIKHAYSLGMMKIKRPDHVFDWAEHYGKCVFMKPE